MEIVRRHRRVILFVLSLVMLSAMTYGFLRRVGVDPLDAFRADPTAPGSTPSTRVRRPPAPG